MLSTAATEHEQPDPEPDGHYGARLRAQLNLHTGEPSLSAL